MNQEPVSTGGTLPRGREPERYLAIGPANAKTWVGRPVLPPSLCGRAGLFADGAI